MNILSREEGKLKLRPRYECSEEELTVGKCMLQYLSCQCRGLQNVYSKNMSLEDVIGTNGEYAIAYLNQYGSDRIDDSLYRGEDYTLLGQVNW